MGFSDYWNKNKEVLQILVDENTAKNIYTAGYENGAQVMENTKNAVIEELLKHMPAHAGDIVKMADGTKALVLDVDEKILHLFSENATVEVMEADAVTNTGEYFELDKILGRLRK